MTNLCEYAYLCDSNKWAVFGDFEAIEGFPKYKNHET